MRLVPSVYSMVARSHYGHKSPGQWPYLTKRFCHLKGAHSVHIGSNDGDSSVCLLGIAEYEGPCEIHLENKVQREMNMVGPRESPVSNASIIELRE